MLSDGCCKYDDLAGGRHTYFTLHYVHFTSTRVAYITYIFRIHKIHTLHTLYTVCKHSHLRTAVHIASVDRYRSLRILHHAVAQAVGYSPA